MSRKAMVVATIVIVLITAQNLIQWRINSALLSTNAAMLAMIKDLRETKDLQIQLNAEQGKFNEKVVRRLNEGQGG